jgi:D-alanyl-lipoteichoic acid acyltransferase DltB (MBOAT superfamily)
MTADAALFVLPPILFGNGAMLFQSVEYLLFFLPLVMLGYFGAARAGFSAGSIVWLLLASLFFYGCWSAGTLWLVVASVLCNYAVAMAILRLQNKGVQAKGLLTLAVGGNLCLLGYFKYAGFFVETVNVLRDVQIPVPAIALPLGISFFTFTQIAFLVDVYRQQAQERNLLNYFLFVTYFPHLIAGPILHHKEMMPQFSAAQSRIFNWKNIYLGLFILATGILKKVVLADGLALQANAGFDRGEYLAWHEAWLSSISYSLQLYFDFSGYTDMAIGASLLLNIRLPENFNSPYKAVNIQDFWRRWHITLSRWLRDYLYIPLGGSRSGEWRAYLALLTTFLLGGLWHGAGWTFVLWGAMHGVASCVHRCWSRAGGRLPVVIGTVLTLLFVNFAWVFFRAHTIDQARMMLVSMAGFGGVDAAGFLQAVSQSLAGIESWNLFAVTWEYDPARACVLAACGLLLVWLAPNTQEWQARAILKNPHWMHALLVGLWLGLALFCAFFLSKGFSGFIYFYF